MFPRAHSNMVFPLKVFKQRMIGRVPPRRTLETLPSQFKLGSKSLVPLGTLPRGWVLVNRLTNAAERLRIRVPDPGAKKNLLWIDMKIKPRRVDIFAGDVAKLNPQIGFVRLLVC